MIVCGYAGIGKSHLAKFFPGVIDLESTPFEKDWDRYLKCAMHYSSQGFTVLVSCHKEIRQLIVDNVPYDERVTIVPPIYAKDDFKKRYEQRGNTQNFIDMQMDNWEKWLNENDNRLIGENWIVMEPDEYLYDCLQRLSYLQPGRFCNYDACPAKHCSEIPKCKNPFEKFSLPMFDCAYRLALATYGNIN